MITMTVTEAAFRLELAKHAYKEALESVNRALAELDQAEKDFTRAEWAEHLAKRGAA